MYNFCAKFQQIVNICKCHSENLINSLGNAPHRGTVPRFSDLEVIALSMMTEASGIDNENYLFRMLSQGGNGIPKLISRRQYDDRCKFTAKLCEEIRKRIVGDIDGGEYCLIIDPKPLEVYKISAFTVLQYINKINDKPIGQVKYALIQFRQWVNSTIIPCLCRLPGCLRLHRACRGISRFQPSVRR